MNLIFDMIFEDEIPYSVVMNLNELEKFDDITREFVIKVRKSIDVGKGSFEVNYDTIEHIWDAWEVEGVRPSYPTIVHGEFTLYQV